MEEPLVKDKNNLEKLELAAIAGSFGGSIAAIFLNNVALASLPLSICLALNFVNRKNLRQDMNLLQETTLFQVNQQVDDFKDRVDRSLERVMTTQEKLNENVIQNKQDAENASFDLKKQQEILTNILDRVRDIAIASQAINGDPQAADYYCQRGANYEHLGYKHGALYDYTKAIEVDPSFAKAFHHRGLIYKELGERKLALEDLRRAAKFYFDSGDLVEYQKARDLSQELYDVNGDDKKEGEQVALKGFMS